MILSNYLHYLPTNAEVLRATATVATVSAVALTVFKVETVALVALIMLTGSLSVKCYNNYWEEFYELRDLIHQNKGNLSCNNFLIIPESIGNLHYISYLSFYGNKLKACPNSIGYLKNLNKLDLSFNQLAEVPESIGKLENLRDLALEFNQLNELPGSIGELTNLSKMTLGNNRLISLPESISELTKLETLCLSDNRLKILPESIGNLRNLKWLELNLNNLTALPTSIGQLMNLVKLALNRNQIEFLPESIGNLQQLQTVNIAHNRLSALPVCIGNLVMLSRLNIESNVRINELPLNLGECPCLTHIPVDGTQITSRDVRRILQLSKRKRRKGVFKSLPQRLELWKSYAKKISSVDYDFSFVAVLDESKRVTINEWLLRLSKAKDFQSNQESLADIACAMLKNVKNDSIWSETFFNQVEVNNTACGDRASQAFNELFVYWRINSSAIKNLDVISAAAKTFALRSTLAKILEGKDELESVEIYLYYESTLQRELGLLTAIKNMRHSDIGKRDWINVEDLKASVRENYKNEMVTMNATLEIAMRDEGFKTEYGQILDVMHKKLDTEYKNSIDLHTYSNQIRNEKDEAVKMLLMKWLEDNLAAKDL